MEYIELCNCPNCGDNEWIPDDELCQAQEHRVCANCGLCKNCMEQYFNALQTCPEC